VKELEAANRTLEHYFDAAITSAREEEEAEDGAGSRQALATMQVELRKAREAFASYREAICSSVALSYTTGSGAGDARLACQISLAREQTRLLWSHFVPSLPEPREIRSSPD
jgi:hypothetical protein